jgi:hypothetical protein
MIGLWEGKLRGYIIDFGCAAPFQRVRVVKKSKVEGMPFKATATDAFGSPMYQPPSVTALLRKHERDGMPMAVPILADVYAYAYTCWDVLFGLLPLGDRISGKVGPGDVLKHLNMGDQDGQPEVIIAFEGFIKCIKSGKYSVQSIIDSLRVVKNKM